MKKQEQDNLIQTLQTRFEQNLNRHPDIPWADVQTRLEHHPNALKSLQAMEVSGGEPDVIGFDPKTGAVTFCDCAKESPTGRRSICYDRAALDARKENKPKGSAIEMAEAMGIALLTEDQFARWGDFWRLPVWPGVHLPQWRAVVLRGARVSRVAAGLKGDPHLWRGDLSPLGCVAAPNPSTAVHQEKRRRQVLRLRRSRAGINPLATRDLCARRIVAGQNHLTQKPKPHFPWPQPSR
jgi:hypothetical protein